MTRAVAILLLFLAVFSCQKDNDDSASDVSISLNFMHHWDGTAVTNQDFNMIKFINENGEQLSIERLRYLISDVTLTNQNGEVLVIDDYNLVDVTNSKNLTFSPQALIPTGVYSNISITFGFKNEKNSDGAYPDLNSVSWNVPQMLGGGYHYMQFDGKFLNSTNTEQGFNYHAIRAVDDPGDNPVFPQDTFIIVNLGPVTITDTPVFNIEMNIAEWFKNPNTWDLNMYNQMLMPNSTAQIMMFENGQHAFNLKTIEQ
ncbi:MbnP family protein [Aestuariivivens sediminicola]|uniref:MbnP family protein n=1 Tax=Aestuariivivens sediminicola TaxID=2913560 RepID=UPI001F572F4D|nr:MbnP family protein [Aestuariivivens sediminicola]